MGVVYKTVDQKLQRTVAIKTLPAERLGDETEQLIKDTGILTQLLATQI